MNIGPIGSADDDVEVFVRWRRYGRFAVFVGGDDLVAVVVADGNFQTRHSLAGSIRYFHFAGFAAGGRIAAGRRDPAAQPSVSIMNHTFQHHDFQMQGV